jgi:hypothetical protein
MKKLLILFVLFSPQFLCAQQVITLSVKQPLEFGFSIQKKDTTIEKGQSVILGNDLTVFGGSGKYIYNWTPSSSVDNPAIIHPIAKPSETTKYVLTVVDSYGCSFAISYTVNVEIPTNTEDEINALQGMQAILFPNPNNGAFKVKLTGKPFSMINISLYNSEGKLVTKRQILNFEGEQTETFQLHLISGTYLLRIDAENKSLIRQFIVN